MAFFPHGPFTGLAMGEKAEMDLYFSGFFKYYFDMEVNTACC